jgi:hypothetical protein
MMHLCFLVLIVICAGVVAWDDVILPPPMDKAGPVSVVYFAQGADITTDQYTLIMTELQNTVDFPLWVGIPQCPFNVAAIPGGLKKGIDRVSTSMQEMGMRAELHFYAGHSLGGAMMPDYVHDEVPDTATGMFLFGAFLTRKFKTSQTPEGRPQVEFPVPSLTVGGELDGLARLSRVVEALYTQVTFSEDPGAAARFMPVTVVGGMNHMQFASGEAPTFVLQNDLQADVSEETAHRAVVADVAAFLGALVYPSRADYAAMVSERVQESTRFVQPLVDALLAESYEHFLPPCYCQAKDEYGSSTFATCASTPSCTGGAGWTDVTAQPLLAGLSSEQVAGLRVSSVDTMQPTSSDHYPHIHGGGPGRQSSDNPGDGQTPPLCSEPSGCTLNITTVTEHKYDQNAGDAIANWMDTGFAPITAFEMKAKMKSRQAVWQAAGLGNTTLAETDALDQNLCAQIQQAAVTYATERVPATTRNRFEKFGQSFVIGEDVSGSPTWEKASMVWKEDSDSNTVTVQAVAYSTENQCSSSSAGVHCCKLLSPARVMEWMYTDGLRNKLGLDKV